MGPPPRQPRRRRPITLATAAGGLSLILPCVSLARLSIITGSVFPSIYTGAVSAVTFLLYGYDKMQARNLEWRVKEATLHTFAMLGGWPGALLGMHYFQHKTRKTAFQVPFWVITLCWQVVWGAIWRADFSSQKMKQDWSAYM